MDESLPITFRPITQNDYGYILASFTRELHKVQPYNYIPNSIFFPSNTKLLNSILAAPTTTTIIASIEDSPDDIVGYLIAQQHDESNLIVYWCQTKAIFRRLGVAKSLLQNLEHQNKNLICPFYFNMFKHLRYKYNLVFDPTILDNFK